MIEAQKKAKQHVLVRAQRLEAGSSQRLATLLDQSGQTSVELVEALRQRMAITVNFHPDRLAFDGRSVIDHLLDDGIYRSQFETRISNGGLTAFDGGDRDRWEHEFFGGAYEDAPAHVRPKYGALDLIGCANGASPRFGSCHLRLRSEAARSATFSFGDSVSKPVVWGTEEALMPLVAEMLGQVVDGDGLLGHSCDSVAEALRLLDGPDSDPDARRVNRELDAYVEVQFHDDLDLTRDVDALVADESFVGTDIARSIDELGERHGLPVRYCRAFRLPATGVPSALRGPEATALAPVVATEFGDAETIDAAALGRAAASIVREPGRWPDAETADLLQQIKYLWHVLVLLG